MCHYGTTADGTSITNHANHVNGVYDVIPGPDNTRGAGVNFNYAWDAGGGRCSSIQCHGGTSHPGWIDVWGAEYFNTTGIGHTLGPDCLQVNFTPPSGSGTFDGPFTYAWDFGDGTTGTGFAPTHYYSSTGDYPVVLDMRGDDYHTVLDVYTQVSPTATNVVPVTARSIAVDQYTMSLTDLSYDPDYNECGHTGTGVITIHWGDGTTTLSAIDLTGAPSNQVFTHTYPTLSSRDYTIQHFVKDNANKETGGNAGTYTVPYFPPLTLSGRTTLKDGSPYANRLIYLKTTSGGTVGPSRVTDDNGYYDFGDVSSYAQGCYRVEVSDYWNWTPNYYTDLCESRSDLNFVHKVY
jgi:hypothetical protein